DMLLLRFYCPPRPLHLHSFPTRRSSDLGAGASTPRGWRAPGSRVLRRATGSSIRSLCGGSHSTRAGRRPALVPTPDAAISFPGAAPAHRQKGDRMSDTGQDFTEVLARETSALAEVGDAARFAQWRLSHPMAAPGRSIAWHRDDLGRREHRETP